jgi:hypothetical protein
MQGESGVKETRWVEIRMTNALAFILFLRKKKVSNLPRLLSLLYNILRVLYFELIQLFIYKV